MKTIKNILLGVASLLTVLMFFQACEKSSNIDYSGRYIIKLGETINVPQNSEMAKLTFLESSDSRCPVNVNCIWQGVGQTKFKLKTAQSEQNFELCTGGCNVISMDRKPEIVVNGVTYIVELVNLSPYPGTGKPDEKVEATILVQKK